MDGFLRAQLGRFGAQVPVCKLAPNRSATPHVTRMTGRPSDHARNVAIFDGFDKRPSRRPPNDFYDAGWMTVEWVTVC